MQKPILRKIKPTLIHARAALVFTRAGINKTRVDFVKFISVRVENDSDMSGSLGWPWVTLH